MKYLRIFLIVLAAAVCLTALVSCTNDTDGESSTVSSQGSDSGAPLSKKIIRDGQGGLISVTEYSYNADGLLEKEVTRDGSDNVVGSVTYTYTSGRLTKQEERGSTDEVTSYIEYVYGEDGKIASERHSDGSEAKYTYNDKGLLGMIDYGKTQVVYRYTAEGVLGQRLAAVENNVISVTDYAYYESGLLATEAETTSNGTYTMRYTYEGEKTVSAAISDSNGVVVQNIEYVY